MMMMKQFVSTPTAMNVYYCEKGRRESDGGRKGIINNFLLFFRQTMLCAIISCRERPFLNSIMDDPQMMQLD